MRIVVKRECGSGYKEKFKFLEPDIGEVFKVGRERVQCVQDSDEPKPCIHCIFRIDSICRNNDPKKAKVFICNPQERKDNVSVKFVRFKGKVQASLAGMD